MRSLNKDDRKSVGNESPKGINHFTPTRRGFIQGTVALAGVAGIAGLSAGALTGCSQNGTQKEGSEGGGAKGSVSFEPGTYEGRGEGKHGTIVAEVTFSNDAIESIEVKSHAETADISDIPLSVIPQAVVATQSLGVDTVSGATLSSLGIIAAIADAATQAGANEQSLRNVPADYETTQTMTPGTYRASAYGKWKKNSIEGERHGCPAVIEPTEVEVTVSADKIESIEVLSCSDTPGFKDPAIDLMPQRIVEAQSLYVDTVSGATFTAAAIASATCKCLQEAGADLVGFAKSTPRSEATEELSCDLVIVGAGLTGTSAALRASDAGIDTIIIERTHRVSGTGACSSGPFAVEAAMDAPAGMTMTADEAFAIRMQEDQGRTNAPLVRLIIHNTGQMIDWIQERWDAIGEHGFEAEAQLDPMDLIHYYGRGTDKFQHLYDSYILPAGTEVVFGCDLTDIVTDDNGAVTTVVGTKEDGTVVNVSCKAVLLCTGGFGGNTSMMEERLNGVFDNVGLSSNTGDAIVLCEKLGCKISDDLAPGLAEFCSNDVVDYYAGYMKFINQLGFLMLDPAGARFMNEELCLTESNSIGAAAMRRATWSWVILTQSDLESLHTQGVWGHLTKEYCDQYAMRDRIIDPVYTTIIDEMEQCLASGQAFKADTLEELCEAVGFNELSFSESMQEYQEAIANGSDPLFGKDPRLLHPLSEGPFYAVRIISPIDNTYNGIRIDTSFRALDSDLKPSFPGLYLAGMDSGGFFTYPYTNFLGSSSSYCLTSGMLAVDSIQEFLGM